jgi:hypothetical protein
VNAGYPKFKELDWEEVLTLSQAEEGVRQHSTASIDRFDSSVSKSIDDSSQSPVHFEPPPPEQSEEFSWLLDKPFDATDTDSGSDNSSKSLPCLASLRTAPPSRTTDLAPVLNEVLEARRVAVGDNLDKHHGNRGPRANSLKHHCMQPRR